MLFGDLQAQPFTVRDALISRHQEPKTPVIPIPRTDPVHVPHPVHMPHPINVPRFDRGAFQQARSDWRAARPNFPGFTPPDMTQVQSTIQDYLSGLRDWRSQRPMRSAYPYVAPATETPAVMPNPTPVF